MSGPSKMPRGATRASVYAHCPVCGCSRRVFSADPDATELYIQCPCDAQPPARCSRWAVSPLASDVAAPGGLVRSSVSVYCNREALWTRAMRLKVALEQSSLSCGPEGLHLRDVLRALPASALHPGLEEWVELATSALLGAAACGGVTEENE